jgi:hypothetical protein
VVPVVEQAAMLAGKSCSQPAEAVLLVQQSLFEQAVAPHQEEEMWTSDLGVRRLVLLVK